MAGVGYYFHPSLRKKNIKSVWCSICGCSKQRNGEKVFHRFPQNLERAKKWVEKCNLRRLFDKTTLYLHQNCKLCSDHFEPTAYYMYGGKRLKEDAVPTVNMPTLGGQVTPVDNLPVPSVSSDKPLLTQSMDEDSEHALVMALDDTTAPSVPSIGQLDEDSDHALDTPLDNPTAPTVSSDAQSLRVDDSPVMPSAKLTVPIATASGLPPRFDHAYATDTTRKKSRLIPRATIYQEQIQKENAMPTIKLPATSVPVTPLPVDNLTVPTVCSSGESLVDDSPVRPFNEQPRHDHPYVSVKPKIVGTRSRIITGSAVYRGMYRKENAVPVINLPATGVLVTPLDNLTVSSNGQSLVDDSLVTSLDNLTASAIYSNRLTGTRSVGDDSDHELGIPKTVRKRPLLITVPTIYREKNRKEDIVPSKKLPTTGVLENIQNKGVPVHVPEDFHNDMPIILNVSSLPQERWASDLGPAKPRNIASKPRPIYCGQKCRDKLEKLLRQNERLRLQLKELRRENARLLRYDPQLLQETQQNLEELKRKNARLSRYDLQLLPETQRNLVEGIFRRQQGNDFRGNKYTPQMLNDTLKLKRLSPAAYNFVRKQFQLPLPSANSLRKYLAELSQMVEGVMDNPVLVNEGQVQHEDGIEEVPLEIEETDVLPAAEMNTAVSSNVDQTCTVLVPVDMETVNAVSSICDSDGQRLFDDDQTYTLLVPISPSSGVQLVGETDNVHMPVEVETLEFVPSGAGGDGQFRLVTNEMDDVEIVSSSSGRDGQMPLDETGNVLVDTEVETFVVDIDQTCNVLAPGESFESSNTDEQSFVIHS